jgi:membrane protease YdiL (CAAX protease family)
MKTKLAKRRLGASKRPSGEPPPQEPMPAKNLGRPPWVILNTFLIFILSQIVAGLLVESFLLSSHRSYDDSTAAQFAFVALSAAGYVVLVRWALKRRHLGWRTIGLGRKPIWRDLKQAAIGFIWLIALSLVINLLLNAISPDINQQRQDLGFKNPKDSLGYAMAFSSLVLLPAISEETLMRGYLYSGLRYWWAIPQAAFVTSFLFALPHLFEGSGVLLWAAAVDTFFLSFILIYLREKTGALYAGMLVHGLNNLIAFGVYFHGLILLR